MTASTCCRLWTPAQPLCTQSSAEQTSSVISLTTSWCVMLGGVRGEGGVLGQGQPLSCCPGDCFGLQRHCTSREFYFESSYVVEDGRWTPLTTTLTTTTEEPIHMLSTAVSASTESLYAGCLPTQFMCWSDASCVPAAKHCDRIPDCVDQSDEFACPSKYCCCCCWFSTLSDDGVGRGD